MLNRNQVFHKLLLCGLDGSGKTTLIKRLKADQIGKSATEIIMSTPFINAEKITLPSSNETCLVYDVSGQVRSSLLLNPFIFLFLNFPPFFQISNPLYSVFNFQNVRVASEIVGAFSMQTSMESSLWSTVPIWSVSLQFKKFYSKWLDIRYCKTVTFPL